ncbi:AI-2E family transporter [Pseudarthrobacter sp. J1738]|uniref:AI-2E family transporter n=1 Tax=unclassified Pseudarthrobacter TaxID=2647000 RepID=UPI003D2D0DCC
MIITRALGHANHKNPDKQRHPKAVTPPPDNTSNEPAHSDTVPVSNARTAGPRSLVNRVLTALRRPIPGAQPRIRFEMPPESEESEDLELQTESSGAGNFGSPGPRISSQHPLYFGFMGTVGVGIALFLYGIASQNTQLILWIVAALFIALGLDPVVRWFESHKIPRPAGIAIVLFILVAGVGAFFASLIPTIVDQVTQIVQQGPIWVQDFLNSDFYRNLNEQFGIKDRITEELGKFTKDSNTIGGIFGGVLGFGSTVANGLFGALIVLVLSLYFLAAMPAMKRWAYRLAPRSRRPRVEALSEEITRSVGNYVIGQACVALLNGTFAFIVMTILHVPFSVLLAFVVVLLAFIPLVGGMIAAVVVILISLTVGWQTAVIYAICYFAYLQFEAYFISPRIMQRAVAVPGAVAVISVIAGGTLLGILGALIAIPTAAAVMLLMKEVFIKRQDQH